MLNILHHYFGTKLLNKIDPEISHAIALCYLRLLNQFIRKKEIGASILKTQIAGMEVPSPIGLAAGFDKNAEVFNATLSLGFGFVEVGTITPDPQFGNPKPRLFRLKEKIGIGDEAIFAGMGEKFQIWDPKNYQNELDALNSSFKNLSEDENPFLKLDQLQD